MIPIRYRNSILLIVLIRFVRIVNEERCSETIGVLTIRVGMDPVGSILLDCEIVYQTGARRDTTVNRLIAVILKTTQTVDGGFLMLSSVGRTLLLSGPSSPTACTGSSLITVCFFWIGVDEKRATA